jgi:hypothetical protein
MLVSWLAAVESPRASCPSITDRQRGEPCACLPSKASGGDGYAYLPNVPVDPADQFLGSAGGRRSVLRFDSCQNGGVMQSKFVRESLGM